MSVKPILLLLALPLPLAAFDSKSFGDRLNGWNYDGSARYTLQGVKYRTLPPLAARNEEGNSSVRVTVLHASGYGKETAAVLEWWESRDGGMIAARITSQPRGQEVDTGRLDRLPEESVAAFKARLLGSFEEQALRAADAKERRKQDLLARMTGPEKVDVQALSAGLAFNFDAAIVQTAAAPAK